MLHTAPPFTHTLPACHLSPTVIAAAMGFRALFAPLAVMAATSSAAAEVEVCPGEGPRYGDFKCNHDGTHRVCAKLIESSADATPLSWGPAGDFWQITGQKAFQWNDRIAAAPNPGDSWCICMWATASLIEKVGCDNVHLRCDATDVNFVLSSYHDGGHQLDAAHACIRKKCLPGPAGRRASSKRSSEL